MAHTLSAKKRIRQNEKRRLRNKTTKSAIKTEIKKVLASVTSKNSETAKTQFIRVSRLLDKAVSKGTLHRNKAARHKSRLAHKIAALSKA